jgi:hypothetical protein
MRKLLNLVEGVSLDTDTSDGFVGDLRPLGDRMLAESGAGLSRIWSYLDSSTPFVQLTAFRGHLPLTVNKNRNAKLLQGFRAFGLSAIRLRGGWDELDKETNTRRPVEEDSFFIPLSPPAEIDKDELADLALMLSRQYDQDAFIFGDGEIIHLFDLRNDTIEQIGTYETIDTHKMEYGWSRVQSNKEKVKIDKKTGKEVVKPRAGKQWAWGFPSDTPSTATPAGSYLKSKLAGTYQPSPRIAAAVADQPIQGKAVGEALDAQIREGFRFHGYYGPASVAQAQAMLRAGTWV